MGSLRADKAGSGSSRNAGGGDQVAKTQQAKRSRSAARIADAASVGIKWQLLKIAMLAIVDAVSLYALLVLGSKQQWVIFTVVLVIALAVNWIYLSKRKIPAKHLTPGVIFLAIFQIFVILYTGYIGFTNYSTSHNGDKNQAVSALLGSALERVPD